MKNKKKTQTDIQMENIAILDLLKREEYSDSIINRVDRSINSYGDLLEVAQQIISWANSCPKPIVELALKALAQSEKIQ